MAFTSPPPPGALQARVRDRLRRTPATPQCPSTDPSHRAMRDSRSAVRKGTLPEAPRTSDDPDDLSSSGRSIIIPPRSSTEPSTDSPRLRSRSVHGAPRRLFDPLIDSESDSEAEEAPRAGTFGSGVPRRRRSSPPARRNETIVVSDDSEVGSPVVSDEKSATLGSDSEDSRTTPSCSSGDPDFIVDDSVLEAFGDSARSTSLSASVTTSGVSGERSEDVGDDSGLAWGGTISSDGDGEDGAAHSVISSDKSATLNSETDDSRTTRSGSSADPDFVVGAGARTKIDERSESSFQSSSSSSPGIAVRQRRSNESDSSLSWDKLINSGLRQRLGIAESESSSSSRSSGSSASESPPLPPKRNKAKKPESKSVTHKPRPKPKPLTEVINLCDSSDDEVDALADGVAQVSLGHAPSWLSSLSRSELERTREEVAQRLMVEFDRKVLGGRLGSTTTVKWNKRLLTTAGYTRMLIRGPERLADIDLSTKVLDEWKRLYVTLAHELCHAAAWVIDDVRKPPHGACFKKWARKFNEWDPELEITRCHSFEIRTKFNYQCGNCKHTWGRHSKSIDTKKVRCSCGGTISLLPVDKSK